MLLKDRPITYLIGGIILFGIGKIPEMLNIQVGSISDIIFSAFSIAGAIIGIWGIWKFTQPKKSL